MGIVTGLAWTEFGGDILTIEAVKMPGKGRMTVTGQSEGGHEGIDLRRQLLRAGSRAPAFGIKPPVSSSGPTSTFTFLKGATPKDGPSAGVAMATAIISVLTGIPIRKDIAMTGEITLRGRVLPIGGLKEKLLAALRSGRQDGADPSGER